MGKVINRVRARDEKREERIKAQERIDAFLADMRMQGRAMQHVLGAVVVLVLVVLAFQYFPFA